MTQQPVVSIILAGGRGSRMNRPDRNKVCFDILGVPAVVRALRSYEEAGIGRHVIVVGALRAEVEDCLAGDAFRVVYAHQPEPLGTGHAARCGADILRMFDYDGLVLIAAGDKLVEPQAVRRLLARQAETDADLVFLVTPAEFNPDGGRVISHVDGTLAAIVEARDARATAVVQELLRTVERATGEFIATAPLRELVARRLQQPRISAALGRAYLLIFNRAQVVRRELAQCLAQIVEERSLVLRTEAGPKRATFAEAETLSNLCNASIYLFKAAALYHGLDRISRDNVQGEEYITDVVKILSDETVDVDGSPVPAFKALALETDTPTDVQGFNTIEELYQIEQFLRERDAERCRGPVAERTVSEWTSRIEGGGAELQATLGAYYGEDPELLTRKREQYLCALRLYADHFSADDPVIVVRSPGRLNLMGRHIDHRGGDTNVIAISDEIILVASPRADDRIELRNTAQQFESTSFSIGEEMSHLDWTEWLVCVNSPATMKLLQGSQGDWAHYVRAAVFRLQSAFPDRKLRGMNVAVCGTIPAGSGLSSSSAVVVGAGDAAIALNGLPVEPAEVVDLCGQGEWFVGTRGGQGDHAAIKLGRRNYVAHVGFLPFEAKEYLPFLEGHSLVVCNSGQQARKSAEAKQVFNEKILGYVSGELLICRTFPTYAARINHLRDINCQNLGIELHELYWMLLQLPLRMTRKELLAHGPFTPEQNVKLQNLFAALPESEAPYDVRGVVLFGLAECERSKLCLEYLRAGDAERFGQLWYISHDGDRVIAHDTEMNEVPFSYSVDDAYLKSLVRQAQSDDPQRNAAAELYRQPGQYRCSTPLIDRLVDMARVQPGVKGAQLAGAGLGGCIIVLVETPYADDLVAMYAQAGFEAMKYAPVEGAGVVEG